MSSELLYRTILQSQHIEYAACDARRRVYEYSPGLPQLAKRFSGPMRGQVLEDLFDELLGCEADIDAVAHGGLPLVRIEKVAREMPPRQLGYLTLTVVAYPPGVLLYTQDVTPEGALEQRVTQQRNELDLLALELATARAQLADVLQHVLPQAMAQRVIANPKAAQLGGERREATIFFANIRGYATLAEQLEPVALMAVLNRHFALVGQAVTAHAGVIHQFVGDMIMASFNTLENQPDHALRAIQAALEAQAALAEVANDPLLVRVQFGIGIYTGPVVVGFLGYEDRFDFTTIGDTPNVAFRLCSQAAGGQILVGAATQALLPAAFSLRALGPMQLKGKALSVEVVEVLGRSTG